MWQLRPTTSWEKDCRYYGKKRPNELAAVLRNLDRYFQVLKASKNSKSVQTGYLHPEPMGVVAIDQKGGGGNLQETRLYVYADDQSKIVHLITIGDKDAQHADIEYCKDFVKSLNTQSSGDPREE